MIQYQEYPPHPRLRAYIDCLWSCEVSATVAVCAHRVLPDNCIDILWQDRPAGSFISGMMTAAETVLMTAQGRTAAVRFKPGGAARFLRVPLNELTNSRTDLHNLWGCDVVTQIADALWEQALTARERIDVLQRHLLAALAMEEKGRESLLVTHAVAAIRSSQGLLKVASLADAIGVSRQHLATRFHQRVGVSTKMFARICRFRHVLAQIQRNPAHPTVESIDWANLAQDCGYADQSHLIHEFREFSGSSPELFALELRK